MSATESLSPRQLRICELAAGGLKDDAIRAELGMSYGTLRTHWTRIFTRLEINTRLEAALLWSHAQQAALAVSEFTDTTSTSRRRKVKP